MKILSIIAQKPSSTGSGVYLSELVRCFKEMGHEQEIICASYESDIIGTNSEDVGNKFYAPTYNKIIFNTKSLPIKIAGMSDVMPYESMRYSELASDEKKLSLWMNVFDKKVREVVERFKPDLIICHHLYLLTSMVVSIVNENEIKSLKPTKTRIYGICHNTDLRQYQQTDLKRDFIKENIVKLDKLFFPSEEHLEMAIKLFGIDKSKVEILGIGYNNKIFVNNRNDSPESFTHAEKLLYVGKVAKKKGVLCLVKAINILNDKNIVLDIIGGAGDKEEYEEILAESKKSVSKINFIMPMTQDKLAIEYNKHDIFILPSFSEGIPMVPLEALACGCKIVISDLPGVKNFYNENVKCASIKYVELPKLTNVDDASSDELVSFEKRLAKAIKESIDDKNIYKPDLTNISWDNIAKRICSP